MTTERNEIVDKAVDLALRQRKDNSGQFDEELASFVGKSSAHLDAYLRSNAALDAYALAHAAWAQAGADRVKSRSGLQRRIFAVAAAGLVFLLVGGVAVKSRQSGEESVEFRTLVRPANAPGRDILSDGSLARLSEGGQAEVRFSKAQRRVDLVQGGVLVNVAAEATRPFVLKVGNVYVFALGTEFSATADQASTQLSVTQGSVSVAKFCGPPPSASENALLRLAEDLWNRVTPLPKVSNAIVVTKGQVATISSSCAAGAATVKDIAPAEMAKRLAWTHQWLTFSDQTIGEVVARLNLENRRQMIVVDPDLALQRFGHAALWASDLDSFVAALRASFSVKASGTDPITLQGADCGWDGHRCAGRARQSR